MKQAGCLHIRLFYEEKFAGNCKGLPSRRKGLFRSSWYAFFCKLCEAIIFLMGFSTSFLLFLSRIYYLLPVKNVFFAAIDAPGGFLFEWWSVFWDIFIARTNEKHSDVAASYIEVSVYAFSCLFMNNFYLLHGCLTCLLLFLSPSTKIKFFCAWIKYI